MFLLSLFEFFIESFRRKMPRFPQFISKKFKKKDFPISEVKTLQSTVAPEKFNQAEKSIPGKSATVQQKLIER